MTFSVIETSSLDLNFRSLMIKMYFSLLQGEIKKGSKEVQFVNRKLLIGAKRLKIKNFLLSMFNNGATFLQMIFH